MVKKIILWLILVVCIASTSLAQTFSCITTETTAPYGAECLFSLSSLTNAHFGDCTTGNGAGAKKVFCSVKDPNNIQQYTLNCGVKTACSQQETEIIDLSDTKSGHAALPPIMTNIQGDYANANALYYPNKVCCSYSPSSPNWKLQCIKQINSCTDDYSDVVYLTNDYNAHGAFEYASIYYPVALCCRLHNACEKDGTYDSDDICHQECGAVSMCNGYYKGTSILLNGQRKYCCNGETASSQIADNIVYNTKREMIAQNRIVSSSSGETLFIKMVSIS